MYNDCYAKVCLKNIFYDLLLIISQIICNFVVICEMIINYLIFYKFLI